MARVGWPRAKRTESRSAAPFPGLDVAGMPADLATAETNSFRRLSPRRHRWPELARFDERAAGFEGRQADVSAEIADCARRLANAGRLDAEQLGEWQVGGERGARPEPTKPGLEELLERLQAEHAALTVAITRVLADKADWVQRHRKRLRKDAERRTVHARAHYADLIDAAAEARVALAELRAAVVWAGLYPEPASGIDIPAGLCGGLRRPLERAGFAGQVEPDRVFDVLRADAAWLEQAATNDQAARLHGHDSHADGAHWTATPEFTEADRREKKAAIARHVKEWGAPPA